MTNYYDRYLKTEDYNVPLRIYVEKRKSVRASLGKNYIILRIPLFAFAQIEKHIDFTKNWLNKILIDKPNILDKYQIKSVEDEYQIVILEKYTYTVKVNYKDTNSGTAKLSNFIIHLVIPSQADEFDQRKMIRDLTSKIMVKVFKGYVVNKLEQINIKHFQKDIKGVTLRYNATNWGSCSTSGRINLSTRSLLLTEKAFEYILVHELSHMVEMNHSQRFWDVVARVMPNYQEQEAYIKENSSRLDY